MDKQFAVHSQISDNWRGQPPDTGAVKALRHFVAFAGAVAAFFATAGEQVAAESNGAAAPTAETPLQRLQGAWEGFMVGQEAQGKISVTIRDHSLRFHRDTNFWFSTTFTLPPGTGPQQLHATIQECAEGQESSVGQVVVAIFKIEEGTLTLVALGGGDEEMPKSFEAIEGKGLDRYALRRVQPPGEGVESPKAKQAEGAKPGSGTGRGADVGLQFLQIPGLPK